MSDPAGSDPLPEVMFLPLAVPQEQGFGDLDPGMLARRIPDFVHQVLNQGQAGPTGVLEVQSPPEEGPVVWVVMDAPPDPEEAFDLLPDNAEVRAVVTGELTLLGSCASSGESCPLVASLASTCCCTIGRTVAWGSGERSSFSSEAWSPMLTLLTSSVPTAVPSLFQSWSFALKNSVPFTSVNCSMLPEYRGRIALTSTVPAGVPSVVNSS